MHIAIVNMYIMCYKVSMNYVGTNFKQNMITKTKPSQIPALGSTTIGIGTPPEKFLPTPLVVMVIWRDPPVWQYPATCGVEY